MLELIKQAKLTYESDTSWGYKYESQFYIIEFYKDESGKNHVEQYLKYNGGMWIIILPTDEEIKIMYQILNDTPYRPVEKECPDWMIDNDKNNGVYNQFN